jgi:sulfofructose kinase
MMGKFWDVLGLGAVAVDDILYVNKYPEVDSKEPVIARERQAGGLAGTALVTVTRLGGKGTYLGILGEDELSDYAIEEFQREGVDCSLVIRQPGARPIHSTIIVEESTGSRTLFFDISSFKQPNPDLLTNDILSNIGVLFVDYTVIDAAIGVGRKARTMGIPVVVDIERGSPEDLQSLLSVTDHLVVGEQTGCELSGKEHPNDMIKVLTRHGYTAVVVTAGERGCWYAEFGERVTHVPALNVDVVDTVGCGDVFHGAYAYSLARGYDVGRCVQIANVAAGLKAKKRGGRSGIPEWKDVERFLLRDRLTGGI